MGRFSQAMALARLASNRQAPGPVERGGLSWRGRLLGIVLLLPGVAAVAAVPFLPASDRTDLLSTANVTLVAGNLVLLLGYPSAVLHAFWTRSLRGTPDSPFWLDAGRNPAGGRFAVAAGLVLAAANLAAAVVFGLLISHTAVELAPTLLFLVAATLHLWLTIARRMR